MEEIVGTLTMKDQPEIEKNVVLLVDDNEDILDLFWDSFVFLSFYKSK